ncbi:MULTISPECIES: OmpA family protein [Pacificibacter]|uniref:OmpA family protein n=1 Tax=Pacificibacter TaxID=1042323 RepID=UPI001C08622F|nr:OmpA family protein [Pacificibacter sp. 1_MG-2023]MBU2934593.1 OmpA family protein [Pacificibacter marinus]MDO6616963.1 OmpA family protein [Pacificibacter sp. 1_MG-2023]
MVNELLSKGRAVLAGSLIAATAFVGTAAQAQVISGTVNGERYAPTIWIDPDGCEHWVMDDGVEGYMDLKVDRQGNPTCHPVQACAVMNSDQLFATDKYTISAAGRKRLTDFFAQAGATAYTIIGHTDSRASDEYNMRLSYNRANAVAKIAAGTGARIADVRGYGERMPIASNGTGAGMQKNRRVEIICIK